MKDQSRKGFFICYERHGWIYTLFFLFERFQPDYGMRIKNLLRMRWYKTFYWSWQLQDFYFRTAAAKTKMYDKGFRQVAPNRTPSILTSMRLFFSPTRPAKSNKGCFGGMGGFFVGVFQQLQFRIIRFRFGGGSGVGWNQIWIRVRKIIFRSVVGLRGRLPRTRGMSWAATQSGEDLKVLPAGRKRPVHHG